MKTLKGRHCAACGEHESAFGEEAELFGNDVAAAMRAIDDRIAAEIKAG